MQLSTYRLPVGNLTDYRQLPQARQSNPETYLLSLATIATLPPLPVVDWASINGTAPEIIDVPAYESTSTNVIQTVIVIYQFKSRGEIKLLATKGRFKSN